MTKADSPQSSGPSKFWRRFVALVPFSGLALIGIWAVLSHTEPGSVLITIESLPGTQIGWHSVRPSTEDLGYGARDRGFSFSLIARGIQLRSPEGQRVRAGFNARPGVTCSSCRRDQEPRLRGYAVHAISPRAFTVDGVSSCLRDGPDVGIAFAANGLGVRVGGCDTLGTPIQVEVQADARLQVGIGFGYGVAASADPRSTITPRVEAELGMTSDSGFGGRFFELRASDGHDLRVTAYADTFTTVGTLRGYVQTNAGTTPLAGRDSILSVFGAPNPAFLQITGSRIVLSGNATQLRLSGEPLGPRRIETWSWVAQALYWGAITTAASMLWSLLLAPSHVGVLVKRLKGLFHA